tara:strand:- start:424 stop:609 length:186 start_codon:yes stop_codon:yes gene_type:complete
MPGKTKETLQLDDWKRWKRKWPYKSLDDAKYIREKKATFKESGNGWWYIQGNRGVDQDGQY